MALTLLFYLLTVEKPASRTITFSIMLHIIALLVIKETRIRIGKPCSPNLYLLVRWPLKPYG